MVVSRNYFALVLTLGFLQLVTFTVPANSKCPASKGLMKRVGNTRYFIFHNPRGKSDKFYNWEEAKKMCSELKDFKMATVEKLTTFAELGRALEKLVTKHSLLDTWYWLDAKYNHEKQMYFWEGDSSRPVKFTNFFYRYPRPTGLAGFIDDYKNYQINRTTDQCLALALPYPAAYNMKPAANTRGMIYGFSATFDEKPCTTKRKRHAICESTLPDCTNIHSDPFTLSEDKDHYFEDGNWLLGDRYFVNWKQNTKEESEKYCRDRGLHLFNPTSKESDLIPHLKMWSRGLTVSQFWTNWTYHVNKPGKGMLGVFRDADGERMATIRAYVNVSKIEELETGKSDKFDKTLCVAIQVSSEFKKSQYPCPEKYDSACNWNFIQYVPANCNNFQGTICEFIDGSRTQRAIWKKKWINNPMDYFNNPNEIMIPFAYSDNNNTFITGFKQTFGSLVCPKGFRMPRITDTKWHLERFAIGLYSAYLESYWVVDDEGFKKGANSLCALSTPVGDGFKRAIKMVPCTEWHFYLCDRIFRPFKQRHFSLPYEIPKYVSWDDVRFERKYPIL